jgi:hypothetical protein
MRFSCSYLALLVALAGCQGPILTGGFNQSPYRAYGVDGPGPGIIPESYQSTSLSGSNGQGMPVVGVPNGIPNVGQPEISLTNSPQLVPYQPQPVVPTSQINFIGVESLTINWDIKFSGTFDSEPCVCPATHDFGQGAIYRLKLSNIPGRQGKELYPTLEIAPTMARTQAFLAHNSIPIEFTDNDFDQVFSGNFITKVVYLPNPEYQGLAMAGVGTLVNTQLEPGVDPIVEASNRGAILAVIRMGNKDLSNTVAEKQRQVLTAPAFVTGLPLQGGYPVNGTSIPQNLISGVNIPPYGTPMTKTSTGIPGPPQIPQGAHSPNRYPIVRAEPIPTAPQPVSVPVPAPQSTPNINPQNVLVHPHYTSQLQRSSVPSLQQTVATTVEPQLQNSTSTPK